LLERSISHLASLLETTYTHLPPYLIEWVLQNPAPGAVGGQFIEGTLLFADISGFTAMSEKLSRIGREGAEEINAIVNRYFSSMLAILREYHGQLIEFGGDALLGLFIDPDSATRAVQAALRMQAAMGAFTQTQTSQGVFEVRMKVGLHRGRFFAAQLGTAQGMEYALFGADVCATAATESSAAAGQVLLDPATLEAVSLPCRASPLSNAPYLVVEEMETSHFLPRFRAPHLPQLTEPTLPNLRRAVELLDALTPYLPAGLLPRLASAPHTVSVRGEHRLVSVLFTNIRGLGEVADRLGPGREAQVIQALNRYFVAMQQVIHRYGGVVNTIDLYEHGDKVFAAFGAPVAHEDDVERAVRAALAMQEALDPVNCQLPVESGLPDVCLDQRIGVSFGSVFAGYVGTNWRHDYTVMGDDVNLSARLMTQADAGSVVVSSDVRRKVQALFEFDARGKVPLKGKSQPVPIFSVIGPRAVPQPLRGLKGMDSPLVGRQAELETVLATLDRLSLGQGQILSIIGEAGLGKSRLVTEVHQRQRATRWIEGRCLSYTESVSFWLFHSLIRQLVGLQTDDSERVGWDKLRDALGQLLDPEARRLHLPYLARFLGLPLDEALREQVRHLDAEALQRRTFVAINALIAAAARAESTPLVLVLDDIHWLDQASRDLLEHLLPLTDRVPLMLLLVYRPERGKACWQVRQRIEREFSHRATEIALSPLPAAESQRLLTNLVQLERWPEAVQRLILGRAEGNPLYLEEVLRVLIDDGTLARAEDGAWQIAGDLTHFKIPDTLQGVLMTRLDRLEETTRWTAQIASVVGRVFAFDVLAHVQDGDGQRLAHHLATLQRHSLIHEVQRTPQLTYAFRHGMMQEVCYRSLLTRTRRLYHRKIAVYLEAHRDSDQLEDESNDALIAHHTFVGQDWPRALRYQLRAGRQAQRFFANHEAIDHFRKALESADQSGLDKTAAERLSIHAALGELLTTVSRYEAAREYLERALALAAARGDGDAQARACRWLARLHELRGDYDSAGAWIERGLEIPAGRETAEAAELLLLQGLIHTRQGDHDRGQTEAQEALRIAQQLDRVTVIARATILLGHVHRLRGESGTAVAHFEHALALYQRAGDLSGAATAHNQIGNAYFEISQWSDAGHAYRQARETFDQLGDVYNHSIADLNLGEIARYQGRLDEALDFYREALQAQEQTAGSPYLLGVLHNNMGAAFIRQGNVDAARERLQAAEGFFDQAQSRDFLPELRRHFAEVALLADDLPQAEVEATRALELAREMAMRGEAGISLRVLGEIAAAQGQSDRAEEHIGESLAILEEMGDAYQSARSRLSLARIYLVRGEHEAGNAALMHCAQVFERLDAALDLEAVRALQEEALS
jgi:predicted ATPase/class 3 adenylate cyclase